MSQILVRTFTKIAANKNIGTLEELIEHCGLTDATEYHWAWQAVPSARFGNAPGNSSALRELYAALDAMAAVVGIRKTQQLYRSEKPRHQVLREAAVHWKPRKWRKVNEAVENFERIIRPGWHWDTERCHHSSFYNAWAN